jgi:hypothetical protein
VEIKGLQKQWLASNFSLAIDGLDCKRVNKISSLVMKQTIPVGEKTPTIVEFANFKVTLPVADVATWRAWHTSMVVEGKVDDERKGSLVYLAPNLTTTLFNVEMQNLGILGIRLDPFDAGTETIRRFTAELYCERMAFSGPAPP